jgi:hypothetical protein
MTWVRLAVAAIAVLLGMFGVAQSPTFAAALAQCNYTPGSVVQLVNTPHLFINDDVGVNLHWGGDTRALQGKNVQWSNQCTVGLPALEATVRGDPWLSAGLPQVGEVIYQAKWETEQAQPTLLRIRTIDDVELFGIQSANYLTFVLDQNTWQSRYGFQMGNLQVGPLASSASFEWSAQDQQNYNQLLLNMMGVESAALFQATSAGVPSSTSLPAIAGCEEQGLVNWDQTRNPSTALQVTQDCLNRLAAGPVPTPTVPTAPANLRLSPIGPNSLRLDWQDTSNSENGFRVLRNNQLIATVNPNVNTFTDTGWNPNVPTCYQVAAFNSAGSAPTPDVCTGQPGQLVPPSAPQGLHIVAGPNNSLQLNWVDTSNNEDGFRIVRGGQPIATVGPNTTQFNDTTWNPQVLNCYVVVAFNNAGSVPSAEACPGAVTPLPPVAGPNPPTNLRLSPAGNAIRLDWNDNSNDEDGFRILRGGQAIATVGPNVTTYTDTGWNPAVLNCYQVVAFNQIGVAPSSEECPGGPGQPPVVQPLPEFPEVNPLPLPEPPLQPIQPLPEPPLQPIQPLPEPPLQPIQPLPEPPEPVQPLPDPDEPMVTPF